MTVRLVKQKQQSAGDEKPSAAPSLNQVLITTRGWVEEYKTRKAQVNPALSNFTKRN
jgi:hypothetical protein